MAMITGNDIYHILVPIVPLYVAVLLGYASLRWWKIFTPEQTVSINRYVAIFAIPTLTFDFIAPVNPYQLNFKFIAADSLQKIVILLALFLWNIFTKRGGIDWTITIFSLATLPNTLLLGVPLLDAMYGDFTTSLSISVVLMQGLIWYNIVLVLYEYRACKLVISQEFNHGTIRPTSKVGNEPTMHNVDLEMGENGNLAFLDSVTQSDSLPYNDGVEMQNKKRSGRSKSCSELGTIVGSTNNVRPHRDTSTGVRELTKEEDNIEDGTTNREQHVAPPRGMTVLILNKVWRRLIKNANIYASLLGLAWAFIASSCNIKMPAIVESSIKIISKTGLGMSMFSLGIFAALQPRIIACGKTAATISMVIRFLVGPAVMAACSAAIGIRGVILQAGIVQAAISVGIVPFVFSNKYNLHAEILSTAVIFGMILALPVTIVYYILLGL